MRMSRLLLSKSQKKRIWVADHLETPAPRPGGLFQVEEDHGGQGGVGQVLPAARRRFLPGRRDPVGRRGRRLHHHLAALPATYPDPGQVVEPDESPRQGGPTLRAPGVGDPGEISPILGHHSPPAKQKGRPQAPDQIQ